MTDHKQAAREIARIYAAESEGIRDGCERAIELLCASVERETIERCAKVASNATLGQHHRFQITVSSERDGLAVAIQQIGLLMREACAAAIRALAEEKGASREA